MRSFAILTTLLAAASAAPQLLDISELESIPVADDVDVPVGAGKETIAYNAGAASASTYANVVSNPDDITPTKKRGLLRARDIPACSQLETGYGPQSDPDTPEAFLADSDFSNAAKGAQTPAGWYATYQNLQGATTTQAYLGYETIKEYNPALCAASASKIKGAVAFNIFFERAPSINPGEGCPNPASTTLIKCSYWGVPIESPSATNTGQYRGDQFRVVIAGSNGYGLTQPTYNLPGYSSTFLDNAAINAPTKCNSYMTVKTFNDGQPFDPARCAAACKAETDYNTKYRPNGGTCQFFTTYILLKNNVPQYQVCALYKSSWSKAYATNTGYTAASGKYTHKYVYAYSNSTNPGTDACTAAAAPQAAY